MEKRVFEEQDTMPESKYAPKKEFVSSVVIEEATASEPILPPPPYLKPPRFWLRLFLGGIGLLITAVVAQSLQWLLSAWQSQQWISLVFAIAVLGMSLAGIGALVNEWRKLVRLRKHHMLQKQSEQLLLEEQASGEKAVMFCKKVLEAMPSSLIEQSSQRWLAQLNEAYNGQEVLWLFGENVLKPIDDQVKKLISKSAVENALIVAISPLAIVDVLMMAWRNIALVNQITRAYGMELGYFSRLKLFKMVLTNMAFAGASEIATDIGSEFFTQNLTAKFSMRAAQGIGAGLLTARLGMKTMEFCRPMMFKKNERPAISVVRQTLIQAISTQLFTKSKQMEQEIR